MPGEQIQCACGAGESGVQRCRTDGSGYEQCMCASTGDGGEGGAGEGSGSGGSATAGRGGTANGAGGNAGGEGGSSASGAGSGGATGPWMTCDTDDECPGETFAENPASGYLCQGVYTTTEPPAGAPSGICTKTCCGAGCAAGEACIMGDYPDPDVWDWTCVPLCSDDLDCPEPNFFCVFFETLEGNMAQACVPGDWSFYPLAEASSLTTPEECGDL